jgi:hypothetical protein
MKLALEHGRLAMHDSGTFRAVHIGWCGVIRPSWGGVSASTQQCFAAARFLIGGAGRSAFSGLPVTLDLFLTRPVVFRQFLGRLRGYVSGQCLWSFA